jgi:hypothetical protein
MSIDWLRLGELREQRAQAARQRLSQDREQALRGEQQRHRAQAGLQQAIDDRQQLWQDSAGEGRSAPIAVAQLRQAGVWSRALDRRIDEAAVAARQAQTEVDQRQAALERSRQHLREATVALERARLMQERVRREHGRLAETRMEAQCEEAAVQTWLAHPARSTRTARGRP